MTHPITNDTTISPYQPGKKRPFDFMNSEILGFSVTKYPEPEKKRRKILKATRRALKMSKNTKEKSSPLTPRSLKFSSKKPTVSRPFKAIFRPIPEKCPSIEHKSMDPKNQERFSQTCNQIPLKAPIPRGVTPLNTEDYHKFLASMSFLKI